jgi:corrinoid protein of di/trimethylamine methyltransferase
LTEKDIEKELFESFIELNEERVLKCCKEALEKGIDAERILNILTRALEEIGRRYERGEYFLAELIASGEIMKKATEILRPSLAKEISSMKKVRMVIGTVEGDIHDIGKNLVITIVSSLGIDIIDLGVDVPAEKFVEAVDKFKPKIVGMSALLTTTMNQMKNVIEALKKAGLRDKVKVIVGGRPVTEEFAKEICADAYGEDAFAARKIISEWIAA